MSDYTTHSHGVKLTLVQHHEADASYIDNLWDTDFEEICVPYNKDKCGHITDTAADCFLNTVVSKTLTTPCLRYFFENHAFRTEIKRILCIDYIAHVDINETNYKEIYDLLRYAVDKHDDMIYVTECDNNILKRFAKCMTQDESTYKNLYDTFRKQYDKLLITIEFPRTAEDERE